MDLRAEREEIFAFLEEHAIEGVFLIAADRHRTDLRVTRRPDAYDLYEFESSRLMDRHTHAIVKTPGLIWGSRPVFCADSLTTRSDPQVTFYRHRWPGDVQPQAVRKLQRSWRVSGRGRG